MDSVKVLHEVELGPRRHRVVNMPGDGSCLFHSLTYLMHERIDVEMALQVRTAIVRYVVDHWDELQVYTCTGNGDTYHDSDSYSRDMLNSATYGGTSELMAAAAIYPFTFEVYQDNILRGSFSRIGGPVKRLQFSGSSISGHYDVLVPMLVSQTSNNNTVSSFNDTHVNTENDVVSASKKAGRPKKNKRGRPKTSELTRNAQFRQAAAKYRKNHPEERKNTILNYTLSHAEQHRESVARYSASHPEVNREAVARYSASHPEVNRKAVAKYSASHLDVNREAASRKRLNEKLQFKVKNVEQIIKSLSSKINDRLEAERLVKWSLYNRQQTLGSLLKTAEKIKNICVSALEKLRECPDVTVYEKLAMFLGKLEHRNNQEPFYGEYAYKVYTDDQKAIAIDETGKAVFEKTEKDGKSLVWSCNDAICVLDEQLLLKLKNIFEEFNCKSPAEMYPLYLNNRLKANISYINNVKSHSPRLRTLIREMYQLQSDCDTLKKIDSALKTVNVDKIKELGENHVPGSVAVESLEHQEIIEDSIIKEFKDGFKLLSKKSLDTPKLECMSCNKLYCSKDISNLNRLRKPISTHVWIQLIEYYSSKNIDHSSHICHTCLTKVRANQTPATCVLNDLFVGTISSEISQLNDYEKLLIQRAKAFQVVVSMNPVANKSLPNREMVKKCKGRTFHLPLPLEETLNKLPKPEDPLNINQELYIMVRGRPTKSKIIWEDIVDINKVYAALCYLKQVNPLYSEIKLPNVPNHLLQTINDNLQHLIETSNNNQDENNINNLDTLLTQITEDRNLIDYEQYTIYPLYEKRSNALISDLYQMKTVNTVPIYSTDKDLDVKCFPYLYPDGKYGQFHTRPQKLTSSEYIKARLMSKHSRFRLDQQYLFYLLHDTNVRQLNSGIFYKMNTVNQKQKITAEQYLQMLSNDELEGDLTAIFARLRNTEQYWKKPRNDVNCMTQHYGPATWFLTMSPSEWLWDDLREYLLEVNSSEMANKTTSELVALDPVSTSRFINNKFHATLDFLTSASKPLGEIEHYFWRREYQSRGAQHFHLMLWVKGAPVLHDSPIDEVAAFISKYVTCEVPKKNLAPTLHQRVVGYQTHKHNKYCMRRKKTKKGFISVCRFGFPRPVSDTLTIRDTAESVAARKALCPNKRLYNLVRKKESEMINDYNPAVLLAWNGNIDIQYVGEKTAILNYYVTKYTTKSEKTHALVDFDDINSTKSLRSRLFNIGLRMLSNRECGALEASDTLLGIPLYATDPQTTIRWLDVNVNRNRRVKSKTEMTMLNPDSTNIYYESWIDDKYPARPVELENVNLYNFSKSYDVVKTRPVSKQAEYYTLDGEKTYLKKRDRPYLINFYLYDVEQMPEKYYFSMLLLFKPWRNLQDLKLEFETYTEAFNFAKDDMKNELRHVNLRIELQNQLQKGFEKVESKLAELNEEIENEDDDIGPDNPLDFEAREAVNAMDDFNNMNNDRDENNLDELISKLNKDQKSVFDMVTETMSNESEILRCFISGTGGTGKSFIIKILKVWVQKHLNKKVAVAAPTGIAAFNVNGLTIHRLLQLPVEHKQTPKYRPLSDEVLQVLRSDLKDVVLFIIDEVSMISNITLAYIHMRLAEIFNTIDEENGWFGKRHIVVLGDLLQLPPVRENSPFVKLSPREITKLIGALNFPNLWEELFKYQELTQNMRQLNDMKFVEMLLRIRIGITTEEDRRILSQRLITLKSGSNEGRLHEIAEFLSHLPADTVCLLPTRNMAQQLNDAMLQANPNPEITLKATDSVDCPRYLVKRARESIEKYEEDASMTAGLEKTIVIKKGVKVMLKRNIDVSLGLVNGAIGIVDKVEWDLNDKNKARRVIIIFNNGLRHELAPVKSKFEIINRAFVHREQFPICVAYAITIHKSQGLSLNNALIDIGSSTFSCGQAYVALSRVTSLQGVHLINIDFSSIKAQQTAIVEYNRLRSKYHPELSHIVNSKPTKNKGKDREWAIKKGISDAQEIYPKKRKKK